MKKILEKLNIREVNIGACSGGEAWFEDPQGQELVSYNPATGEPIAKVIQATDKTYDQVIMHA
ncbi:MAG: aldehyde dehydrogenase family protein, partial [Candidatus Aminicenantes bacterium]|nr:aldehyde dehydrogenase family protein [Candidatus Aminicenantes bacterium]